MLATLTVNGTASNDDISISTDGTTITVQVNLTNSSHSDASISDIIVNALGGADLIIAASNGNNPVVVNCGTGNDTALGGTGDLDDLPSLLTVNGESGTDVVVLHDESNTFGDPYTVNASSVTRGFFGGLNYSAVEAVQLLAEAGNNSISIPSTLFGTSYLVMSGGGDDTISIGAGNLDNTPSAITVDGESGNDHIIVNDSFANFPTGYTLQAGTLSVNAGASGGLSYFGSETLTLLAEQSDDTINLNSAPTMDVIINAGTGNDTISVGNGTLFFDNVTVNGQAGTDAVSLNAAGFNADLTITNTNVAWTPLDELTYGTIESLSITAGPGANSIFLNTGTGNVPMSIFGTGSDDFFEIDPSGYAVAGTSGAIQLNGGNGFDTINFRDQANTNANTVSISATSFSRTFTPVFNYTNLTFERLNLFGGNNAETYNVTSTAAGTPVDVTANAGNDVLNFGSTGTLASMGTVLDFFGGSGTNTLNANDLFNPAASTYIIQSGFISRNSNVLVNFVDSDVINFTGSNGGNTLNINGTATGAATFLFTGGATDTVNINNVASGPPVTINGGNGADVFTVDGTPGADLALNADSDPGDRVVLIGAGTSASVTPNSAAPGDGTILFGGRTITFTGLNSGLNDITADTFLNFTYITPNGPDTIAIGSNSPLGVNIISGTSGGVALADLQFKNVTNFILDTGANDGVSPSDTVTINPNGLIATGLASFRFKGGASPANADTLTVNHGTLTFNNDAAVDTANLTLNINPDDVGSAAVAFNATQHLAALNIGAGGFVAMTASGTRVLLTKALTMSGLGRLDLADNDLIVDYTGASPLSSIQALLTSGYNNGAWNGNGISSSAAAALTTTAIGFAEATHILSVFPATFSGQPIDNTSILLKYTLYGDADLNGNVNVNDFTRLASNFGTTGKRWSQGNFDFNSIVNVNDFTRLAANFGLSSVLPEIDDLI